MGETHVTTSNLERGNHPLALGQSLDIGTHLVDDTAELVTQDITLFELDNSAMEKMQVATADCAAGNLEDDVARF